MSQFYNKGFVLDCSLTMTWCFPDEATSYTVLVRNLLEFTQAKVPSLWSFEVANVLWAAEKAKRITVAHSLRFKTLLKACPIIIDINTSERAMDGILDLAREQDITVYDAAYLELSMREGIPIATLDKKLQKAAMRVGVHLLKSSDIPKK